MIFEKPNEDAERYNELMFVAKIAGTTLEKEMVYQAFEKIAKLSEKLDKMIDENNW